MPQPVKHCIVHVLDKDGKTKVVIHDAVFPEIPQIGWKLVFDRAIRTTGAGAETLTDIEGVVTGIIMLDNSQKIIVYIKYTK